MVYVELGGERTQLFAGLTKPDVRVSISVSHWYRPRHPFKKDTLRNASRNPDQVPLGVVMIEGGSPGG
jgi:hypothetical protein